MPLSPPLLQALAVQLLEVNTPEFVKYSKAAVSNAGTLAEALIAKGHKLAQWRNCPITWCSGIFVHTD